MKSDAVGWVLRQVLVYEPYELYGVSEEVQVEKATEEQAERMYGGTA